MALTLPQHFSFSRLDTLILRGGLGAGSIQTSSDTCTIYCNKDLKIPPPEIVNIGQIRTIKFAFCPNLDLAQTFLMLGDMPNLKKVHFNSCNIIQLPPEIWALYRLRILEFVNEGYLDNNEFVTFPAEISQIEQLKELSLSGNRHFQGFPPEIARLKKLTSINLRGFHSLPVNLGLVPNLEHLYLVFSGIVPSQIEPLIDRPNALKSVTVGEDYFTAFKKLTVKYPSFSVGWEQTSMRGNY